MRHGVHPGVAPLNDNPKWPEGYFAILREIGVQERVLPFFATWVRRFLSRFPGRSRRSLGRVEIEAFLNEMTRRNDVSNWQIAQARDTLELYYEQFRSIALAARPETSVSPDTPSPSPMTPQDIALALAPNVRPDVRTTYRTALHGDKQIPGAP